MISQTLFVVLLAVAAVFAQPSQLSYDIGDEFAFNLNSYVDSKGQLQDGSRTDGSFSTMNGIVMTQVQDFSNNTYLFVMNMFDVEVNVGQSLMDLPESKKLSSGDDSLGYDMYFAQSPTGEILQIWYQEGDSPYFVNVKVGAINAFQTRVVPPNQQPVKALESDPVGNHYSYFVSAGSNSLTVSKTFTQQDFSSFPDPNLRRHNININANTQTTVHPSGHIAAASVLQDVVVVNINPDSSARSKKVNSKGGYTNTTGFDMLMSSFGNLSIAMANDAQKAKALASWVNVKRRSHTFETLHNDPEYASTDMFSWAAMSFALPKRQDALDFEVELAKLKEAQQPRKQFEILHKWINNFNNAPHNAIKVFHAIQHAVTTDKMLVDDMLFVLSSITHPLIAEEAQTMLIKYGLRSSDEQMVIKTILAIASAKKMQPGDNVVNALIEIVQTKGLDNEVGRYALLALGATAARVSDKELVKAIKVTFKALAADGKHQSLIIDAIGNGGGKAMCCNDFLTTFAQVMRGDSVTLKVKFLKALRKFSHKRVLPFLVQEEKLQKDKEVVGMIHKMIGRIMKQLPPNEGLHNKKLCPYTKYTLQDSNFPYNKSYDKTWTFGGKSINAQFELDLFLGTNFDCNQQYFNYEGLAEADATINFYSESKSAFEAEAVYGKANGQIVGNELYLRVWDDVIYQQQLPVVDCNAHTYPILQKSTGFDLSYTVWVSVIPVTFSAGVDLSLDLSWGWQICDSSLYAMVELIPDGALVISGNAEIDLLIIKAGVTLSAQFEATPSPQGYIQGSECEVGVDVDLTIAPMEAEFLGYYAWDHCKYWIFDCHWGEHNQQVFWSWNHPGSNEVIFNKAWKIASDKKQ